MQNNEENIRGKLTYFKAREGSKSYKFLTVYTGKYNHYNLGNYLVLSRNI